MPPTSTTSRWSSPDAVSSGIEKIKREGSPSHFQNLFLYSDSLVVLYDRFEILGDDRFPFSLSLHVSAGPTAGDPGLLDALGVVTDEGSVYHVLAWPAAEFASVFIQIEGHGSDNVTLV